MNGWQRAGAPVNRGRQAWDLELQVRLAAGSVVAASVLGSTLQPRLEWIGAAIGAGLAVAAISDTCVLFEDVVQAHQAMEEGLAAGKMVVAVS